MTPRIVSALLLAIAAACSASLAHAQSAPMLAPGPAAGLWSQLAEVDLAALRTLLETSHPGAVDTQNPEVRAWIAKGSTSAQDLARRTTSYAGLQYTLAYYGDGFNDSHVLVYPVLHNSRARYPGFVVALRGGHFVVVASENAGVPVGAQVQSCDGTPAATLYERNVLPFHAVSGVRAQYIAFAPYLFADFGNPFITLPSKCDLLVGTSVRPVNLVWQSVDAEPLKTRFERVATGPSAKIGLTEWKPGHFWIGLPSFGFTADDGSLDEENVAAMNRLLEDVAKRADALRMADAIVFDVRGNDGGSSEWGDRILRAIWGQTFTDNLAGRVYDRIEWRTSDANIAANEAYLASFIASYGPQSAAVRFYKTLVARMREGRARGEALVPDPDPVPDRALAHRPAVKPRVVLLGNGTCVSACNDFADAVLSIAGAELWGEDNNADSVYIENRGETLPSGLFRVSLPMKVWRGRARGNNETYAATRKYDAPFASDAEARAWVEGQLREGEPR